MSKHFSHVHMLKLTDQAGTISRASWRGNLCCEICGEEIKWEVQYFSCMYDCWFGLHKTCKDFPRVLTHSFHPQHFLTLTNTPKRSNEFPRCNACGNFINSTFSYRCFECDNFFMLDLKCATLVPLIDSSWSSNQISSHQHPLILCEQSISFDIQCGGCELSFDNRGFSSSPIYVCLSCRRLLHESCASLPQDIINHPFHPQHSPLEFRSRIINRNFQCSACHESRKGLAFKCSDCPFILDILCATIIQTNSEAGDHHHTMSQNDPHPHPLINCDVGDKSFGHTRPCFACNLPLKHWISFCVSREIFLHKSCIQLPQQIQHIIHPLHPLTLHDSVDDIRRKQVPFSCKLCLETCSRCFSYQCDPCGFKIEARCALQPIMYPMVKSELHNHPLVFSNSIPRPNLHPERIKCRKCYQKFNDPFLHCQGCDFYLHAHCLSQSDLPPTAKHKCHLHPLSLTYSPIRDFPEEGENAELYCDACEEGRHLHHPTYYCQECHFVSHVHCVISEVISYMQENADESEVGLGEVDKEITTQKLLAEAEEEIAALTEEIAAFTKKIKILSTKLNEVKERHAQLIASKTHGKSPNEKKSLTEK